MALTAEQKKFYEENGFILLDNIFTKEEVEEMSEAYDEIFNLKQSQKNNLEATWQGSWKKDQEERSVLSIHSLQCHNSIFTKTITNKKLVDAVAVCIGSPNVLLHHTKAHIKPPEKGTAFPAHQDYHYFPYEKHSMVAAFVHIDDSDIENGGLMVYPGSHKNGPLEDVSDNPDVHYVDPTPFPVEKAYPVNAKKGDVVIFSYLTVHASYPNVSTRTRRMFLIQMMAAEDKPTKQVHTSACQGMVLRGKNVERNADITKRHEA